MGWIRQFLAGQGNPRQGVKAAPGPYLLRVRCLKRVWDDESYGLERMVRFFLCAVLFLYPGTAVRSLARRAGPDAEDLAVDAYSLLKPLVLIFFLVAGTYLRAPAAVALLSVYLVSETVFSVAGFIFLSDIHGLEPRFTRAMLLLMLNYIQVVLAFAVLHLVFTETEKPLGPLSAVYYSIVTGATLGYGDFYPVNAAGQALVILQLVVFVLFITVFFNYFSDK